MDLSSDKLNLKNRNHFNGGGAGIFLYEKWLFCQGFSEIIIIAVFYGFSSDKSNAKNRISLFLELVKKIANTLETTRYFCHQK
jgi:hypothetical protein